jgi:glycosyltransferase involved in cell wall biosynthesis
MRILCVIDSLSSGGAQRQLVNLAVGFKDRGHEVSFLVYQSHDFYRGILDSAGIPITTILEPNYLFRLYKMRKYIRNGNYSSVLSFLETPNLICEIAGLPFRKWKLVVGERSANPQIFRSLKLILYRWAHLLADHVVANSFQNIQMVCKINPLLPEMNCHVIYNLVELRGLKAEIINNHRKKDKFRIVVAASHRYLKNLNRLIEAVDLLDASEKDRLQIDWFGDQSSDGSLQVGLNQLEELKLMEIFNFYKATKMIEAEMYDADAVGLFSIMEGLPNVICEAMMMGKPIISSSVSDVPLLLKSDPNCLFDPDNTADIKRAISYILTLQYDKLEYLGRMNKQISVELFNKDITISRYVDLLNVS